MVVRHLISRVVTPARRRALDLSKSSKLVNTTSEVDPCDRLAPRAGHHRNPPHRVSRAVLCKGVSHGERQEPMDVTPAPAQRGRPRRPSARVRIK